MVKESIPDRWKQLPESARTSTVAFFCLGWQRDEEDEVLIWEGVEDVNGNVEIEDPDAPEEATHIIESHKGDDVIAKRFSTSLEGAKEEAKESMQEDYEN